jgi:uncharacterized membrane protein YcaP (DUF421 family)
MKTKEKQSAVVFTLGAMAGTALYAPTVESIVVGLVIGLLYVVVFTLFSIIGILYKKFKDRP